MAEAETDEGALTHICPMLPNCKNFVRCRQKAKSKRATLCSVCFLQKSCVSGARSAGNKGGNPGNAGNASGNPGNHGNAAASGKPGNTGNTMKGVHKKPA